MRIGAFDVPERLTVTRSPLRSAAPTQTRSPGLAASTALWIAANRRVSAFPAATLVARSTRIEQLERSVGARAVIVSARRLAAAIKHHDIAHAPTSNVAADLGRRESLRAPRIRPPSAEE